MLQLEKQCTKVEERGGALTVHFGEDETVECDLMLVSVGRAPLVEGLGLEEIGVELDRSKGIAADEHRRTTVPHIYAVGDCAGYWQLAHTAFREGEVAAENATGHDAVVDARGVPRPIYTDPEIAGVGLTEAEAREQYGDDVAVGVFPWVANARAVMQNETVGWVKSIHETRYGELLGLVMVGPHVTDLIEAGVVALDAEATVETVADGMAPHPTLSEAIKEAGLVALGPPDSPAAEAEGAREGLAKGARDGHRQQAERRSRLDDLEHRQAGRAAEGEGGRAGDRGRQAEQAGGRAGGGARGRPGARVLLAEGRRADGRRDRGRGRDRSRRVARRARGADEPRLRRRRADSGAAHLRRRRSSRRRSRGRRPPEGDASALALCVDDPDAGPLSRSRTGSRGACRSRARARRG